MIITTFCSTAEIVIDVEKLSKPAELLEIESFDDVIEKLILTDNNLSYSDSMEAEEYRAGIVAKAKAIGNIVDFGFHPFFKGMYQAYAEHRPFTLSPDMLWLLMCQGFSQHVNNNAEALRKHFVSFTGNVTLVVKDNAISLNNPESPWERLFPQFTKQIKNNLVEKEIIDVLSCDFSTTTANSRIASEITIQETFKPYFEYLAIGSICGIPKITLKGTPADWQKVYDKAQILRKYDLDWWIDTLNPVLLEIIKTSKGNINRVFWRNMFKYHSVEQYGAPKVIDGWIVKFFPYDKGGDRNDLKEIQNDGKSLPNEMVKADLKFLEYNPDKTIIGALLNAWGQITGSKPDCLFKEVPLELWAGFVGLKQDGTDFNLTPEIGWFIRRKGKDRSREVLSPKALNGKNDLALRVKYFPEELLKIKQFGLLSLYFTDTINIPEGIKNINIYGLSISGKYDVKRLNDLLNILDNVSNVVIILEKVRIRRSENSFQIDTFSSFANTWIPTNFKDLNEFILK